MSRTGLGRAVATSQFGRLVGALSAALLTLSLAISSQAQAPKTSLAPPTEPASPAAAASAGSVPTQELTANDVEAFLDGRLAAWTEMARKRPNS